MASGALLSVLSLLGVFSGLSLWLTRRRDERAPRSLRVLERQRLGGGHSVWLIAADERRLLVGCDRDGLSLLADITPTDRG